MEDTLQQNNSQTQQNQTVVNNSGDEMAPRTKEQFEKLTTHNQTLNQENEALKQQLETLKAQTAPAPAPLPQQTVQQSISEANSKGIDPSSYIEVDSKTGERFVNETKLEQVLSEIQKKTTQVETNFQNYVKTSEEQRLQQQREAAYRAHPELEPGSENFNKDFYRRVKETIYGSMLDPAEYGKVLSIKEAADYVKGETTKTTPAPKDGEGDKKQDSGAKVDASTQVPSVPQNAPQPTNSEDLMRLRMETRKGSVDALAQRLLATDHVLKTK